MPPLLRSLRFRTAAWITMLVLATAAVSVLGVRLGVRWALVHELDRILAEDLREIEIGLQQVPAAEFETMVADLDRKAEGHEQDAWFVQLVRADGSPVYASPGPRHVASIRDSRGGLTRGTYRLRAECAPVNPHGVASIHVGASLASLSGDIGRIDRLAAIVVGLMLGIAPLTGYWLAGRLTRPVGLLTATAARLQPDRLDDRLPLRSSGDELDRLALTINGLLDRIAEDLRRRRDFLANAAHELRTPLAGIRSSIEVSLAHDRTAAEYQECLADVLERGTMLETLVNQLLLISESDVERGRIDRETVDLGGLVAKSVAMFEGVAESRGITLRTTTSKSLPIPGNRHLLQQMINNLIDNAIKYTRPGGEVEVTVASPTRGTGAYLEVSDTGMGISEEELPKIFDRFYRADRVRSGSPEIQGNGLGLSVCQAIASSHGGTIACSSRLGEGTRFIVHLPAGPASIPASIDGAP